MTLGFSLKIDGQPMHFMEKILNGHFKDFEVDHTIAATIHHPDFDTKLIGSIHPKIHTIRVDKKGRWRVGMPIQMVIHNRTKKRFQFAPTVPVTKIQSFDVMTQYDFGQTIANVRVDGLRIGIAIWENCKLVHCSEKLELFIKNDGFQDVNSFFEYFSEDFSGTIIHWHNQELTY